MASSSIGANVWHSWHFMHKRNDEMEEEVQAVHSVSLQLAEPSSSLAAGTCVEERTSVAIRLSSLLGTAKGSRPSHTTIVHKS